MNDLQAIHSELRKLRAEVAELRQRCASLPSRWGLGGGSPVPVEWVRVKNASAASSGSNSTAGIISYDVYAWTTDGTTPAGNLLATQVSLVVPRWVMRSLAASDGSPALAYRDGAGTYSLVWVFGETRGYKSCVNPS